MLFAAPDIETPVRSSWAFAVAFARWRVESMAEREQGCQWSLWAKREEEEPKSNHQTRIVFLVYTAPRGSTTYLGSECSVSRQTKEPQSKESIRPPPLPSETRQK